MIFKVYISSTRTNIPLGSGGSFSARTIRELAAARVYRSADPFQPSGVTTGNSLRELVPPIEGGVQSAG